jgi:hypothetical protein
MPQLTNGLSLIIKIAEACLLPLALAQFRDCSLRSRSAEGDPTKQTMPQLTLLSFFVFKAIRKPGGFLPLFKQKMLLSEHCLFCDPEGITVFIF